MIFHTVCFFGMGGGVAEVLWLVLSGDVTNAIFTSKVIYKERWNDFKIDKEKSASNFVFYAVVSLKALKEFSGKVGRGMGVIDKTARIDEDELAVDPPEIVLEPWIVIGNMDRGPFF